jgi:hypothetical protein
VQGLFSPRLALAGEIHHPAPAKAGWRARDAYVASVENRLTGQRRCLHEGNTSLSFHSCVL